MSTTIPAAGYLIITAISGETGEASSETYQLASLEHDSDGERAVFQAKNEEGERWVITHRPADAVPLEVEPYRQLLRILIDNDARYPGQGERLSTYLDGASPELLALVDRER